MVALRRVVVIVLAWSLAAGVPLGPVGVSAASSGPQVQAPGRPYSGDCSVVLPEAERLRAGLAVHERAMQRAKALIAAAKASTTPLRLGAPAVDGAKAVVTSLLDAEAVLRKWIETRQWPAEASASRARVLKNLDSITVTANFVDILLAGGKYQQAMAEVTNLRQLAEATGTYLLDAGVADMAVGSLTSLLVGEALGGPAGVLIVQSWSLVVEVAANVAEQKISAGEVQDAQDTYDVVKYQYDAMQARIQNMIEHCAPATKPEPKPSARPTPPPRPPSPPPAPAESSPPPAPKAEKPRAAGNPRKVIAVVAVAAGAGVGTILAVNALKNLNFGNNGCDTSKAPINEVNYYCYTSFDATLCNKYTADYDAFCKSCGFSGFDKYQGKCK